MPLYRRKGQCLEEVRRAACADRPHVRQRTDAGLLRRRRLQALRSSMMPMRSLSDVSSVSSANALACGHCGHEVRRTCSR